MPKGRGNKVLGTYNPPSDPIHYEEVDQSYYVRAKDFFYEGRVFSVIMNETAGSNATDKITDYNSSSSINRVKYKNNYVYTNVRRFIVVRQKREFCYACPIFTYGNRGTTKRGVRPSEHGIAYSWGYKPQLLQGETGITKLSIPVVMAEGVPVLHAASRIYYGIMHPIQYNVKVKEIGYVPNEYVNIVIGNWKAEDDSDTEQSAEVTRTADIPEDDDEEEYPSGNAQRVSGTSTGEGAAYETGDASNDNNEDDSEVNDLTKTLSNTSIRSKRSQQ